MCMYVYIYIYIYIYGGKGWNYGGMRGTRDRDPRCTRTLPLDISKGPRQEEPVV